MKPTLLDLYRQHSVIHAQELFEIPGVEPIAVLYLFVFHDATQQDAEQVLACFNRLAQTEYTFDDIATIKTPQAIL